MAAQLPHCQQLTTLDLGDNKLGPEGAKALAAQLRHCQQLTTLDLGGNELGEEGAQALAAQQQHCPQLTTQNLANNSLGDEGVAALLDSLKQPIPLETLSLHSTLCYRTPSPRCCRATSGSRLVNIPPTTTSAAVLLNLTVC